MPTVAIIGRPNAGKSTLFNRLIGERKAIESDIPGTTRDRVFGTVKGEKIDFLLVDTGGLTTDRENSIEEDMRTQAEESVAGADIIYFCVDVRSEITAEEEEIANILRKKKPKHVPVFLVGTKSERHDADMIAADLYRLGVSNREIFFVSAKEWIGVHELLEATEETLIANGFQKKNEEKEEKYIAKMALLGRPNAGKSTLTNILSGKEISIVSPLSGTTRDNIDSIIHFEKEEYLLIDTAGIRKKSGMNKEQIERFSRLRALSALSRADITILLIDAMEGITHQDQAIASELKEAGVGVMIVFSKWDLAREKIRTEVGEEWEKKQEMKVEKEDKDTKEQKMSKAAMELRGRFLRSAQSKFPFLSWAPVMFLSSVDKKGISDIFTNAKKIMEERNKKISTNELNIFLGQVLAAHPPASRGTKKLKVKYGVQVDINPPAFAFFANDPDAAHFSFRRYIENRLREVYGFWGTPIKVEIRKK